jgi:hypothetical protein
MRGREVRASDQQRLALRDEGLVDIGLGNRHVGAVLAQKDQRERILVFDAHDRAGQARRIDADMADVASFARSSRQETPQPVVADAQRSVRPRGPVARSRTRCSPTSRGYLAKLVTSSRRAPICCA